MRPSSNSRAPTAAANLGREHQTALEGTQGAPRKMRRQGAATPGATHRVSVGGAPSVRLPRQPHTAPLKCLPPHRHGGANSAEGTQGAPRKMRRQGAATPGPTHRVSVGCAPSLRLPRQSHTSPLRYFPPAPMPSAARDRKMIRNDPAPKFVQTAIHSLIQTRRGDLTLAAASSKRHPP